MNIKNHHEHRDSSHSKKALKLAIGATAGILVIEVIGGIWTNSLALLSDAAHVFMDLLSFILSYTAILLAERPISDTRTLGWHRLEFFAAIVNGLTVFLIAFTIFWHALRRLVQPEEILSMEMLGIALFGLLVNLFVIWKLHPHLGEDVNVRSAFLHAVGDALASCAVVLSGGIILATKNNVVDPIAAIFVSVIIVFSAFRIFKDSVHILLEGVPKGLDRGIIIEEMESLCGKKSVRDLHIWNICSHICALSMHVTLPHEKMQEQKFILQKIDTILQKKFNIIHSTVQIESEKWHEEVKP